MCMWFRQKIQTMSREVRVIRVAVGILKRHQTVLVAKRPLHKPYSGYWEFPGGKIESNESADVALARELHEELGINVLASQKLFDHAHHYPDKSVLLDIWLVTDFQDEPTSKEQQELRWVTYDEMLDLRLLEGNWAIIDKLKRTIIQ
jgi:8-oxo-dGTP diphosphatase